MKDIVVFFKVVMDFLSQQSEEQLSDLATGRAKLKLVYEKNTIKEEYEDSVEIQEICKLLESFTSREDAIEFFKNKSFEKNTLRSIGKKYNIGISSKETNDKIVSKIIDNVVGAKLRFEALLNTNLD